VSTKFAAKVPKLQSRFTLNSAIPPGRFLRESYLKQNYNNMSNTYIHRIQKNLQMSLCGTSIALNYWKWQRKPNGGIGQIEFETTLQGDADENIS